MKNSKGFTLVEVLAAFVILGIIIGIGIVSYQFIMARVERNYYETLEQELLLAGSDYYNNNRNEKPVSGYSVVLIDDLIGNKYIETLKDRSGKVCGSNNDSKVYIYKTDTGYDYEACLVCNDNYQSTGNYCNGNILGEVFVSAKKENTNAEYNVLKTSYSNTSWSNESVVVTFKMIDKNVTKYVIVNTNDNSEKICNATNNSCSMTFNSSGSYTVKAYDGDVTVGAKKSFHVKIDKEKPVCEFISGPSVEIIDKELTSTYILSCKDNVGLSSNGIVANDFIQTSSDVVLIESVVPNATNDQYTITVRGNTNGSTALKLKDNVVTDNAGNSNLEVTSESLQVSFACEWVPIQTSVPNDCTPIAKPSNPSDGDIHVKCDGPIYGKWRYTIGSVKCLNGITISGTTSNYTYTSSTAAEMSCSDAWRSIASGCYSNDEGGPASSSSSDCKIQQSKYYQMYKYEYQCN